MSESTGFYLRLKKAEKKQMELLACKSGCSSLSSYIRKCALNKPVKTQLDSDLVLEILKMNADLSRLGNLLRLTLKTHQGGYTKEQLSSIENTLKDTTNLIKQKVENL